MRMCCRYHKFHQGLYKIWLLLISSVSRLFHVPIQHIGITDIPFCLSALFCLLRFVAALLAYTISCIGACSILSHESRSCLDSTCLRFLLHSWSPGSCYTDYASCIRVSHFCHTCASNSIPTDKKISSSLSVTVLVFPSLCNYHLERIHPSLVFTKSISYFFLSCSFSPFLAALLISFQLFTYLPSPLSTVVCI